MKVIAEVGSNWLDAKDCAFSIEFAARAGADAVKFQMFTARMLYGPVAKPLSAPKLPPRWLSQLAALAKANGIEFMCTGFSPEAYRAIDPFVQRHKIASAELTDTGILETVNSLGKPALLSTGGSSFDDVEHALRRLKDVHVTILFCVADYPAKIVDFRRLQEMRMRFGSSYLYGYSDHSTDAFNIPRLAKSHGCSVIEKHVNFTPLTDTPDAPHSISGEELTVMVKAIKGDVSLIETQALCDRDMKSSWKRRFVALKDIERGERIDPGLNVGIYRPTKPCADPVSTFRPQDLKKAARAIRRGETIALSHQAD